MNYNAWADAHLTQSWVTQKGHKTSIWHTIKADKPLYVMVHGINGNHFGLVPLAVELAQDFQLVIVELPGHGHSGYVRRPSAIKLQQWFSDVLAQIEREYAQKAVIVAHSFGCMVVLQDTLLKTRDVVLLNPVPTPSEMYERYSRIIMRSSHFWAHIYNWRAFVFLRGLVLAKIRTRSSLTRVRWAGRQELPSYQQIMYQAGLVDVILDPSVYDTARSGHVKLVVCGMADTTATERDMLDMRQAFGLSDVAFLNGGHLLPIETPDRVAYVIREAMVH
jgi:pimeloyl-ACP methyl ester carboxylesterase